MSKYTTETATLKALVIDTNVLKINGFVFKPTMDGLTLTPPAPPAEDDDEEEEDTETGGSGSDTETGGDSSGDSSSGGSNIIIGDSTTGGGVIIGGGGGVINNIVNETTIIKEQKLKTITYTIGEYITGVSNDIYTCSLDDETNTITVNLLDETLTNDNWSIEKVLINDRLIMCPIYRTTTGWCIKFAEVGDKYGEIYGGIDTDTKIKLYLTYDEPLETEKEVIEDETEEALPDENPDEENPENPEEEENPEENS